MVLKNCRDELESGQTDESGWSRLSNEVQEQADKHAKRAWRLAKASIQQWVKPAASGSMTAAHGYLRRLEACGELGTDIIEAPLADLQESLS